MIAHAYECGIADGEREAPQRYVKDGKEDYIIGLTEGRACRWLRERGIDPPPGIGAARLLATAKGWKP